MVAILSQKQSTVNPSMQDENDDQQIRRALDAHWHTSAIGDLNAEHEI
jgi:hypothetical protein